MILLNGEVIAQTSQFSLNEVDVCVATVDLEEVRAYRSAVSRGHQAARSDAKYHRLQIAFALSAQGEDYDLFRRPSPPLEPKIHSPEEEIALCGGCYLWDYLRRSGQAGAFSRYRLGVLACSISRIMF